MIPRRKPKYLAEPRGARAQARREVEELRSPPLISIAMPTFNTPRRYLREAIESVRRQHYPNWELCIADDGSTDPAVGSLIRRYTRADPRIKAEFMPGNQGISAASNCALALCSGELVGFLDHDDALTADALLRVAQAFAAKSDIDVVYSDQDKITPAGQRADPFYKPDWSPVYALGAMYIGHLLVLRRSIAEQVGGFDPDFDTIQDFEFMLRVAELTERIHHIPRILYHWRAIPGSIAAGTEQKSGVPELQAKAVSSHLRRRGIAAAAVPHPSISHRARLVPDRDSSSPRVSIVIPSTPRGRRVESCLDALLDRTVYPDPEVIVVEGSMNGAVTDSGSGPVKVVRDDAHAFHHPRASNLGARHASGEYLIFLTETTEVSDADWIEQLLMYGRLPKVGAAGPLLVHPDGTVDQAGIAIGLRDPASPAMRGFPADGDGYYGSLPCAREVSAVSADCMLIARRTFERVGGFREIYNTQFGDIDLCQRLRAGGMSVVYTPSPRMTSHQTAASRQRSFDLIDRMIFVDSWYEELVHGDPYFNPNFSPEEASYLPRA